MNPEAASPWEHVRQWEPQVSAATDEVVAEFCSPASHLYGPVTALVRTAREAEGPGSNRLFPLAVLGALSDDPTPAVPVCVVSSLWSAGTEAVDDFMDAGTALDSPATAALTPTQLLAAGTICTTVLPALAVERLAGHDSLARHWQRDLAESTLASAEGQLADLDRDRGALDWARVMRAYAGKTGAGYARDALMAARCATDDPQRLRGWHVLGQLLGILRQMHNDNDERTPDDDEDLANGTPTLLLAHVMETADTADRERVLELRAAALRYPAARAELRALLHAPEYIAGYRTRIGALRHKAGGLLNHLAGPSPFREAIQARIDDSAVLAVPALSHDLVSRDSPDATHTRGEVAGQRLERSQSE
jgi:heptaprenyl diphosphate synthase